MDLLVRGETVWVGGVGGAVAGVLAGSVTTLHLLGRPAEAVERVEGRCWRTCLVRDTALVTLVVVVTGGRVLQLNPVAGAAHSPVGEGVVALAGGAGESGQE